MTLRDTLAKIIWEKDNPRRPNYSYTEFEEYPKSLEFIQEVYKKVDAILEAVRAELPEKQKRRDTDEGFEYHEITGFNEAIDNVHTLLT